MSDILDSIGVLLQQDDRANRMNGIDKSDNFVFMGFCFSHSKIITKKRQKSKRLCKVQIFVDGKLHQLDDNQYFSKMRYTDFLSDLGRNQVKINFLFEVGAVLHHCVFAQVQNNGFFFYAEV